MQERFIIESFWQRGSNCACVAFIKALLLDGQMHRTFFVKRRGQNIFVTLSDRHVLVFTDAEIRKINRGNQVGFKRPRDPVLAASIQKIRSFAELCFAILVRRMQLIGFEGKEYTQQQAIDALVKDGVVTSHFHKLLGVARTKAIGISNKKLSLLRKKEAVLLYNQKHITVASNGWYEDFGRAIQVTDEIPLLQGKPATHFYQLRRNVI